MERAQLSIAWLENERLDRNWTQAYVAEQIGVDSTTVRKWESGIHKPQPRQYRQLCKLFGRDQLADAVPSLGGEELSASIMEGEQAPQLVLPYEIEDAYTQFQASDLTTRLEHLVWMWPIRNINARYHELPTLLIQELEQKDNTMQEDSISRRDALRRLASLPIEMCGLSLVGPVLIRPMDEILSQCAAGITACWYLRKGKDLAFASDTVSRYIPTLREIVKTGSLLQRKDAAELLVQSFLLKSTLTFHVNGTNEAVYFAQQAEAYGYTAENIMLQVIALRTQAAAHSYAERWEPALQIAKKAKYLLETAHKAPIPQLVHSYIYAGLATYQAYSGQKQDAFISLKKAHTMFFNRPNDEQASIWIDHNQANLILNDGMTHYYLDMHKEALDSFEQTKKIQQDDIGRVEILVDEVMAEISRDDKPRDMEWSIMQWTQAIQGAKTLRSDQWFKEATTAYKAMRVAWPGEQRIKELREHIIHW